MRVSTSTSDESNKPALSAEFSSERPELSVVMPCLNEGETLAQCIQQIQVALQEGHIIGEVVVADNGSSDNSVEIADTLGARVVHVPEKGYGNALRGGIEAARGKYIIMGDADSSYDFGHIPRFLERLRDGYDLVMGNRFAGGIRPGAMPHLHRYLGNPVLTGVGRLLFGSKCGDFHCGLRAFSRHAYDRLGLRSAGMEFASEMVVKAALKDFRVTEVPTTLSPDGRSRPAHLRSWRDGWRHLRFMLLHSPHWLFLYPGVALIVLGLMAAVGGIPWPGTSAELRHDLVAQLCALGAVLLGLQAVAGAILAEAVLCSRGIIPPRRRLRRVASRLTFDTGLVLGLGLFLVGIGALVYSLGPRSPLHPGTPPAWWLVMGVSLSVAGLDMALTGCLLSLIHLGGHEVKR